MLDAAKQKQVNIYGVPHKEVENSQKKNLNIEPSLAWLASSFNKKFSPFLQNKQVCWLCLKFFMAFFLGTLVRLSALPSTSVSGTSILTAKDLSKKSSKKWRQCENPLISAKEYSSQRAIHTTTQSTMKIQNYPEFVWPKNIDFRKKICVCTIPNHICT